jgi:hypothetical protein
LNNFSENIRAFKNHLQKTYFTKEGEGGALDGVSPSKDKKEEEL